MTIRLHHRNILLLEYY